ncbi:MAG: hypothetical protein HY964_05320 [Ignavibacteriales bacterium]|nr:hypothetical protein [Ignavibacteriales bacterium]
MLKNKKVRITKRSRTTVSSEEFGKFRKEFKSDIDRLETKIDFVEKRLDAKINNLDIKIDSVEKRLDAKIDFSTQSMKDYTNSKFNQMQHNFDKLNNKLDVAVKGIVEMLERSIGYQSKNEMRLDDHENRITLLESNN